MLRHKFLKLQVTASPLHAIISGAIEVEKTEGVILPKLIGKLENNIAVYE